MAGHIHFQGCISDSDIADKFATFFSGIYSAAISDNHTFKAEVHLNDNENSTDYSVCSRITVENIDACIRKMHLHKAAGPDGLMAQHLRFAHPCLIIHIKLLFTFIMWHGYVPDDFGCGIIVPFVKDNSGNINNNANYRPTYLLTCSWMS